MNTEWGCGKVIKAGTPIVAFFARPHLDIGYAYLWALCPECSASDRRWTSDYLVGKAADELVCGLPVHHEVGDGETRITPLHV